MRIVMNIVRISCPEQQRKADSERKCKIVCMVRFFFIVIMCPICGDVWLGKTAPLELRAQSREVMMEIFFFDYFLCPTTALYVENGELMLT